MARFVSHKAPVSVRALKRKSLGAVVRRHYGRTTIQFTRIAGGWMRDTDVAIVTSAAVAAECNQAIGCRESWARIY